LRKYNLKGTFYVPRACNLFSNSLSENEIRELSGLVEIGGHTMSHQVLTTLTFEKAHAEIYDCKTWLEDVTGKAVYSFCPPVGRFNKYHISAQQEAGFTSMRTVEMLSYSFQKIKKIRDFVILPTTCQVYNHTGMAYVRNNVKRMKFLNYPSLWRLFDSNWESMSRNYMNYLCEVSLKQHATLYFHLWGHSWEINNYSLWSSLERFFKAISEIDGIEFLNNAELAGIARKSVKPENLGVGKSETNVL
jgi:peptidoglycan/xylan/chitin deacetylase (PgdA/CDA1 family)